MQKAGPIPLLKFCKIQNTASSKIFEYRKYCVIIEFLFSQKNQIRVWNAGPYSQLVALKQINELSRSASNAFYNADFLYIKEQQYVNAKSKA